MGNVLNMNTKLAMTKLARLSKGLSKEYNVPFGLDKNMSIFDGKTYSDVYLSLHDPLEKDRCIAAINLKLHPEWLEQYPALNDMDLSYEHVIEDRYAELVSKGKAEPEKIYERTYEEAKQRNFGTMNEPVKVPLQLSTALLISVPSYHTVPRGSKIIMLNSPVFVLRNSNVRLDFNARLR